MHSTLKQILKPLINFYPVIYNMIFLTKTILFELYCIQLFFLTKTEKFKYLYPDKKKKKLKYMMAIQICMFEE